MPENARERYEREERQATHRRLNEEHAAAQANDRTLKLEELPHVVMAHNRMTFPHAEVTIDTHEDGSQDITFAPKAINGETSDGYHTFNELYRYRMLYHAAFVNTLQELDAEFTKNPMTTVKSWKHSDGELAFGGGWFIVVTTLPTGQISNHYEEQHWDLFQVPEVELPPAYDGHTPAEAADRLARYVRQPR